MSQQSDNVANYSSPVVFWSSAALVGLLLILGFVFPEQLGRTFTQLQTLVSRSAGWFYILTVNLFLLISIWLMFSRFGKIRLGGEGAVADFSLWGWFAMLFSAGMGIGLVFWSVAEPIYHFSSPPFVAEAGTPRAAQLAMSITIFHWGLHAWAIYAVIALALAYFAFNRHLPLTIRSVFHPILGDAIYGPAGYTIDVLAVMATMFGLATSLGLGAQQINAGLLRQFGIEMAASTQIIIIVFITMIAVISVVLGLKRGIKVLSQINMVAATLLLLFVLMSGPTLFIFDSIIQNTGDYLQRIFKLATWTESYRQSDWQHSWTIFYWAWWISWSPFVGMFIARISRGRTIKEFMLGVLLVPTTLTIIWLSVFGGAAMHTEMYGPGGIVAAVQSNTATALYVLLSDFPMSGFTSLLAMFIVMTFFVTSSDSGSLVIDTITSGGQLHPPVYNKIFWATMEGLVASVLLVAGGLKALQAATVLTGLPFAIVLLLMCYCLYRGLQEDHGRG